MTERKTRSLNMDRRSFVASAASLAVWPCTARAEPNGDEGLSLGDRASRKGLHFGAAVGSGQIEKDRRYTDAILADCTMLVPEWEMKWGAIEPTRYDRDYAAADYIVDFALENGLSVRGHTAVWANHLPEWSKAALLGPDAQEILDAHTSGVIEHFRNRLDQWDVVNEAVEPKEGRFDGLRNSILMRELGPEFIDHAFELSAEIDPRARRYYNDTGFWADTAEHELRRRATLRLLTRLKSDGVPIQGLGMQAHLEADAVAFDQTILRAFLKEVAALDLEIMVTELDVNDRYVPGSRSLDERDAKVADMTRRYLDTVLDEPATVGVIVWGLSDRYTWLNGKHRWAREDGRPNRCLPLDAGLRRKPMWHAIAAAFDGAPDRRA
jgi:endo-1,4-beta-xylanase